ncbi:hypothetical protein CDD82_2346 [Ophiocordyceps australis]|uniref:Uncharacterized protein n=1 Tax=Ophiocordyceps australis TaxID=1399860 RepID=A0A2C5XXP2_9HYPO|nr:hypothetical protein CDD82_2346 [Ophiocordyceps australis]
MQISAACAHRSNTRSTRCRPTANPFACPSLYVSLTVGDEACPECKAGVADMMAWYSLPQRVTFAQLSEAWRLRALNACSLDMAKPPLHLVGYSSGVDFDAKSHWVACLLHAIWTCCPNEIKVGEVFWPSMGPSVMSHNMGQIAAVAEMAVMCCIRKTWDQMFFLNDDGSPVLVDGLAPIGHGLVFNGYP